MTHHNACVRIFHTDNGTEYVITSFDEYLSKYGIIHQTTCPGTSKQNGLAERKNIHPLEVTHCLIMEMNVAKFLWSEAVIMASYLINRISLRVLGYRTPLECFTGKISYVVPPKSLWMCMLCKGS
jgi:transposase InsO family protein